MAIEVGKAAPAFSLKDADGNKVSLADFKGKDVVVYFYPKDDTPGCTKEACGFNDALPDFGKAKAEVVGISRDSVASHESCRLIVLLRLAPLAVVLVSVTGASRRRHSSRSRRT